MMNPAEMEYLETLIPGYSPDLISPSIASGLLLLPELAINEALTLSLFYCAHCIDHEEDIMQDLSLKKSDLEEVAVISMRFSNILRSITGSSNASGKRNIKSAGPKSPRTIQTKARTGI